MFLLSITAQHLLGAESTWIALDADQTLGLGSIRHQSSSESGYQQDRSGRHCRDAHPSEMQSSMQDLLFDGKALFTEEIDTRLHGTKNSRMTLQTLGLCVPAPAKPKFKPQQTPTSAALPKHFRLLGLVTLWLGVIFLAGFFYTNVKITSPSYPQTNVMFLKTHKTASSTVMNILFRFAEKHNLTLALPAGQNYHLGYPHRFMAQFVEGFKTMGQSYNIMCNHMRFNLPEVRKVMPNTTTYFSIMRNPISLMESSYAYFKFFTPAFRRSKDVNEFLASPWTYYNMSEYTDNVHARNYMWFDFGYDNNAMDTEDYVQRVLAEIEQAFQLMLLTDYFDESMVLLKETLGWEMDDVVYFKLNSRSQDTIKSMTPESKEKVKEWCSLDWKLYQHFNRTFWRRIQETIGLEKLDQEVNLLRMRQKELMELCLLNPMPIDKTKIKDKKLQPFQSGCANILGYNLKEDMANETLRTCLRLITPELQYMSYLYARQFPEKKRKSIAFSLWRR
ncbi:galactose-3-O-sulfotransferase 2-like [Gopherus flavomarginatus]|uniref:galactose-3-O-sulfotransferase 2-like n=1 Tax=Gopherus flavomarginatus TaxID=286002 RepID=UPI0021CBE49A|nr:galactose-3-O-sulfotransferase 2-like [Gopherus flavomarginatus]